MWLNASTSPNRRRMFCVVISSYLHDIQRQRKIQIIFFRFLEHLHNPWQASAHVMLKYVNVPFCQSTSTRSKTSGRLPNESWWWTGRRLRWLVGSLTTRWKRGCPGHPRGLWCYPAAWSSPGLTAQRNWPSETVRWESCRRFSSAKKGSWWGKSNIWDFFNCRGC